MGRSCCVPTATCAEETNSGRWHNVTQARQVMRDKPKRQRWLRIQCDLKHGSRDVTSGHRKRVPTQKGSSGPHNFSIAVAAGHRETTGELRISSYRSSPSWPTSVAVPSRQSSRRYQSHAAKTGNSGHYDRTHNEDMSCVRKKNWNGPLRSQPRRPRRIIPLEGRRNEEAGRPCNRPRPFASSLSL